MITYGDQLRPDELAMHYGFIPQGESLRVCAADLRAIAKSAGEGGAEAAAAAERGEVVAGGGLGAALLAAQLAVVEGVTSAGDDAATMGVRDLGRGEKLALETRHACKLALAAAVAATSGQWAGGAARAALDDDEL